VTEIDFITAFGRLLRNGALRDQFAADPQAAAGQINLRRSDWPAWQQLVAPDVEFQASVLLRKRLDLVKFFAPETCRRMGEQLWPVFHGYARAGWPVDGSPRISDTLLFCQHLRRQDSKTVAAYEWNRLDFASSKKSGAWHWVQMPEAKGKGKNRRGLQIFLRGRGRRWREFFLYFGI
jgi:hypothetical protein